MKVGYARVSTQDQNLELQTDALKKAGCELIFKEKISGKSKDRPELTRLFDKLRKGDELVVWKLDRLGRSIRDLIDLVTKMHEIEVAFISLQDSINTHTASGRFTFNLFASLAEFEREIIRERTNAGIAAARARGRKGGRPKGLPPKSLSKAKTVKMLYDQKEKSMEEIAKDLSISETTAYRYLHYIKNLKEEAKKKVSS